MKPPPGPLPVPTPEVGGACAGEVPPASASRQIANLDFLNTVYFFYDPGISDVYGVSGVLAAGVQLAPAKRRHLSGARRFCGFKWARSSSGRRYIGKRRTISNSARVY